MENKLKGPNSSMPSVLHSVENNVLSGNSDKRKQEVVYIYKDIKQFFEEIAGANGTTVNVELNKLLDEVFSDPEKREWVEKSKKRRQRIEELRTAM